MNKLAWIVTTWFVFGTAANVRADRLFATHFSIWGQSKITELDPQTGSVIKSYSPPATPNQNAGLAFDGTSLYFLSNNSPDYNTVYKLNPDTGAVLSQYTIPSNSTRTGLTVLGNKLYDIDWNPNHNVIEIFDLASGTPEGAIAFRTANPTATKLMLSGDLGTLPETNELLAVCRPVGSHTPTEILRLDASTGVIQHRFTILDSDASHAAKGVDLVGQEIFVSLHVANNGNQVIVYNQDGVEQRRFGVSGSSGVQALASGATPAPEPSTFALLSAGILAWIGLGWQRRPRVCYLKSSTCSTRN